MSAKHGSLSINSENIFPIIKKWLYSDHDIFVREMISNGCDAITKLRKLEVMGDYTFPEGYKPAVNVIVDPDQKTLKFIDNGIGMTADEVEEYITQIAFSGATEFLEKYKDKTTDDQMIGHFGLGFYSAFMVADEVHIDTLSYKEGSTPVHWTCDGGTEYEMADGNKTEPGTEITLFLNEESLEFANEYRMREVIEKYCSFMPVNIYLSKENAPQEYETIDEAELRDDDVIVERIHEEAKTEEKENDKGEKEVVEVSPAKDKVKINKRPVSLSDPEPLWMKHPNSCTDEEYKEFYRKVFMDYKEPLFWIHLNVDYPFHLTGILYFPKVKSNIDLNKNKIQLYCNQVYVTDSVEGIVPDFLTLLHGVLDSPDIPLNVSRSYLQSDSNVKKISTYISKKVSDRLQSIFKNDRAQFEEKWNDLKIFINYGMLTQEDFYDKAQKFALFTDTDGKHYTFEEYQTLIKDNQTDKDKNLIYLYANNKDEQFAYIEAAKNKGYNVLLMDGQLDVAMVSMLEQKLEKSRFTRVDSDVVDNLIVKEDKKSDVLEASKQEALSAAFKSQLPKMEKVEFNVMTQALGENGSPVMITQSEYMRRMKEMANIQAGMSFYGEMPDMFNLVLNSDHKLVKEVLADEEKECSAAIAPIQTELEDVTKRRDALKKKQEGKKDEDIPTAEKDELNDLDKKWDELKQQKDSIFAGYAGKNKVVRQLIDLALLQNNMLKGEALNNFVKRSIELI